MKLLASNFKSISLSFSHPRLKRFSNGLMLVCLRGVPISQAFTLAANLREQRDSPVEEDSGAMFTNISVFASPPKQGWITNQTQFLLWGTNQETKIFERSFGVLVSTWRRYVSFEFRNGTWSSFFAKANMTSPRDDKLLLIAWRKKQSLRG